MIKLKLLNPLRYDVEDGETVYSPSGEWVDSADFDDLADAYRELMEENARLSAAHAAEQAAIVKSAAGGSFWKVESEADLHRRPKA